MGNVVLNVLSCSKYCVSLQEYQPDLLMSSGWKRALLAFAANWEPKKSPNEFQDCNEIVMWI